MVLVTVAGCAHTAGHDFARPEQAGVVLGQTTEAEILTRYGAPLSRNSITRSMGSTSIKQSSPFDAAEVPGEFTFLRYGYVLNQPPIAGGDLNQKGVTFTFWNGALVAHDFTSSFAADSSDFDEGAAEIFLALHPTRDELIARLGNPGGRFVYPVTPTAGMERLRYSYQKFDATSRQRRVKTMDILFNASGQLVNYLADNAVDPFAPVAPAPSGGLLFLRVGHTGGGRR